MRKTTKIVICTVMFIFCTLLCACQKAPERDAVISKNDGSFDAALVQPAADATQWKDDVINYDRLFYSTDGSVEFKLSINKSIQSEKTPVIEVVPHYLSSEDAKNIAHALFGNQNIYEARSAVVPNYSKDEILAKINRWSQFTSEERLAELVGEQNVFPWKIDIIKTFVTNYTEMYESAPKTSTLKQCDWTFKKDSYYWATPEDLSSRDLSNDNDTIACEIKAGEIGYFFDVSTRNKKDFKLNNVSVYLYDGVSPDMIDETIFRAQLCRTEVPTDAQIDNVKDKAHRMLTEIKLGEWHIDECYVETRYIDDTPEYSIHVSAVPCFSDVVALRHPQLSNLKSTEVYASNYYLTDAQFEFSANGDIVSFYLFSPVDIKETISPNANVMNLDSLVEIAINHLTNSDASHYGVLYDKPPEEITCVVNITDCEYGLTRVKVPNSDESYYYVPGIMFKGQIQHIGKESGTLYFEKDNMPIVTLNGIDGTIVRNYS